MTSISSSAVKCQVTRKLRMSKACRVPEGRSASRRKAAPKSRLQVAQVLFGVLGGLRRLGIAGFARCRVVDLADVVGLDRESLVLHAVNRVRLGLNLAFNDDRRPGLERGGELRQRPPNLNLEPIGILVLGAVLVFPLLVDGNAEVDHIAVGGGLLFGVFAEVAFEVDVVFVAGHDVLLLNLVASESGHTAGTDMGRSDLPSAKQSFWWRGTTACLGRGIRKAQRKSLRRRRRARAFLTPP